MLRRIQRLGLVLAFLLLPGLISFPAFAKEERKTIPFSAGELKVNWDWNDFKKKSSSEEVMNLAIAGLAISGNASDTGYGSSESAKVEEALKKLGFIKIKSVRYKDEKVHEPALTLAMSPSKVGGKTVVLLTVRGTTLDHPESIVTDIKAHIGDDAGFQKAGAFALEQLRSYIRKQKLTRKKTILYLTGHSYGAATISEVALNCSDLAATDATFVYSFAAPDHYINGTSSTGNSHIRHYVNADDAVPRLINRIDCGKRGSVSKFDYDKENGGRRGRFELAYYYLRGVKFSSDSSLGFLRVYNDKSLFRDHMDYTYMAILLSNLRSEQIPEYFSVVPEIRSVKAGKGSQIKVKWKQVSHVDGYEYACKKGSGKYKSCGLFVKDYSGDTYSKASTNGTYYFRARSFVEISGRRFFSSWSKAKSVKIQRKVSLKLNKKSLRLTAGKSAKLKATLKNSKKTIKWKSSDKSIATVSKKGKVKAKKAGTAIITASAAGKKATCKVTVRAKKKKKTIDLKKYYRKGRSSIKKAFPDGQLSTDKAEYDYYRCKGGIEFAFPKPYSDPAQAPASILTLDKKVKGYKLLGITVGMDREAAFKKLRKQKFKRTVAVGITYYWENADSVQVAVQADSKVQSISYGGW